MLVISARKLMGITPASTATADPTMTVFAIGVPVRLFTRPKMRGAMPSRDVA
ncbi:hypothetical protein [Gulosibacter sediminis]|uniref:hypothetical protein n=1 Tax=Gulosibacter sediminis TaxID=1729695 RepID=UPI001F460F71|nr:hypothetical protein [Gulosibacter sediminis]